MKKIIIYPLLGGIILILIYLLFLKQAFQIPDLLFGILSTPLSYIAMFFSIFIPVQSIASFWGGSSIKVLESINFLLVVFSYGITLGFIFYFIDRFFPRAKYPIFFTTVGYFFHTIILWVLMLNNIGDWSILFIYYPSLIIFMLIGLVTGFSIGKRKNI